MSQITVIGAGRIGLPVAARLVRAGHAVSVYDIRADLERAVGDIGATWAGADFDGEAEVLLTVLPGSPELRSLMLGEQPGSTAPHGGGLLRRLRPGCSWIDLTSASPALGSELAEVASGVGYLDAPVGGGTAAAADGTLQLYVGGERGLFDRTRTLLRTFAANIRYTGGPGTGYLTKLLVNLLWFGQSLAVTEVLLLGRQAGLDPSYLREVLLDGPASSAFIADYLPSLLEGDHLPAFGLDRIVEELDSIEEFARREAVPFELSSLVARLHRDALAQFGSVDGELLGAAFLQHLAGRRLHSPS